MDALSSRTVLIFVFLRASIGLLGLLTPRQAARVVGVDPDRANDWLTRMLGARELALAARLLAAPKEQVYAEAMAGVAVDSLDVVSSAIERGRGRISTYSLIIGGGGAALFVSLGLATAQRARRA